jgi:DNA-binding LytR/AlgR family response regulator
MNPTLKLVGVCSSAFEAYAKFTEQESVTKMEEQLKGDVYLRVHRSYLVHRLTIRSITKDDIVLTNGEKIPIGDQYRVQISRKHIEDKLINKNY